MQATDIKSSVGSVIWLLNVCEDTCRAVTSRGVNATSAISDVVDCETCGTGDCRSGCWRGNNWSLRNCQVDSCASTIPGVHKLIHTTYWCLCYTAYVCQSIKS